MLKEQPQKFTVHSMEQSVELIPMGSKNLNLQVD